MRAPIFVSLLLPTVLSAQQLNLTLAADSIFARWNSTHEPGCAVGMAQDGRVLLTRGYGMADLETGRPITPETLFESGSVAKQFTAAATVTLALDGLLDLDDPARKYVPELPDYGRPITIRHLLTHTSGLREWSDLVAWQGWPRGTRIHTQELLLDVVTRQRALNYPTGDYYSYTNSGYGLLFTIVERVSGMTFQEFSQERLFQPLGMTHTQWRDDFTRVVRDRAQAYRPANDGWALDMPFEDVVGPGGLLSTVGDFLIWNDALTDRTLGAPLVESLSHRMRTTNGHEIEYALGLRFTSYRGVPEISHSGATASYRTFLARYPDRGHLSVVVLCNAANANPTAYAHALVDRVVQDFPPAPPLDTSATDSAAVAPFAGLYRNTRWGDDLDVGAEYLAGLRRLPDGTYWSPRGTVVLLAGAARTPRRLGIIQVNGDTLLFEYAAAARWAPTAKELAGIVGRYYSDELDVKWDVQVSHDTLFLSPHPGMRFTLTPSYRDGFSDRERAVWFTRDRRGRVTAMHVGSSRLWDLVLTRLP